MKQTTFLEALKITRNTIEGLTYYSFRKSDKSVYICDNLCEFDRSFVDEFKGLSQFNQYSICEELTGKNNTYNLTEDEFNYVKLVRLLLLDLLIESLEK